jgi:hypothetical protein
MVKYIPPIAGFNSRVKVTLSTEQTIPANTETVVAFDSIIFDGRGEFNTTNHRFVAQEAGYYFFGVKLNIYNALFSENEISIRLRRNGIGICYFRDTVPPGLIEFDANVSTIVYLNAGDYLDVTAYVSGAEGYVSITEEESSFSVHRLS